MRKGIGLSLFESFFIASALPTNIETGTYQPSLVVLSYIVASFAAYTALSLTQQLSVATSAQERRLLHWGGAFAMGAGIWSMHFIGMLSYKMRMVITYDPSLTVLSLLIAISVAYIALSIAARKNLSLRPLLVAAVVMGFGICGMHYTGMAAMQMDADLRYLPDIFLLSVGIAIIASAAAIWMAFKFARSDRKYRSLYQIAAALIMGAAICGMHYTGMFAAVFMPYADCRYDQQQDFNMLAIAVAAFTAIILGLALSLGAYRRAQAEKALFMSENKLRTIIEGALDAIISMDSQGNVTEWNKQAEQIFGWSRQDAMGNELADLIIPPAYREAHRQGMQRFLTSGTGPLLNRRIEVEGLNNRQETIPIELSISAQKLNRDYQFTAFVRDITERKQAESRLQASEAKLRAVVEHTVDGIITINAHGFIHTFNPACERIFGYKAEEVRGKNIKILMPEPYHSQHDGYIARYTETKEGKIIGTAGRELLAKRKDGSIFPMDLSISAFQVEGKQYFSGIIRDITDRKKAEESIMRYTQDLERSNRELDDFAHIASHDLKEPLRGIHNHARFLMEDNEGKLDQESTNRLHRLIYLSQRMEKLVNDLLYFSRLGRQALAVQLTDINDVVRDIESTIDVFLKENNARIIVAGPLPTIRCDKPRVAEVFRNLITNAVKYTETKEKTVEIGFLDNHVKVNGKQRRNVFYVKDNGRGIDPQFHEEIFRIFRRLQSTTGEQEEGTGAGLTFVKKIVERHGGEIWVESALDQGATFYFTLEKNIL